VIGAEPHAVLAENRAKALSESGDENFVLTADGTIRWSGDPVAKLVASDNAIEPRFRILADEQLTGPAREGVEERLTRWLKAHIEKLLGPLIALGKAEDVTGIARGVAFQLVEAFGVLERQRVAEEVKSLDQPTRAILRQHGVRFGAYHIYLPALLKPAPRSLSLLLWGLKNGGLQQKGITDLPGLASSGRTSIPVDAEIPKPLYRLVGYRLCGSRAIRVDILERLADLVRPALAWRPGGAGEKPAGAFDGRGFTITVAMTSLVGCAGEDFAAILRALGYRMDRRPPLPAEPAPTAAPETASENPAPEAAATEPASSEAAAEASPPESAPAKTPAEMPATESETPATEAASDAPKEPEMVEVWRPGRPASERRPKKPHDRERRRPQHVSLPASGEAQANAASEDKPQQARPGRKHRGPRKHDRKPHGDSARPKPRPERRERPIDPNSPFAALLELKARLESGNGSGEKNEKKNES
jgi:ATP-dependent RNA helicase SUPV3L1/SUV3